MTTYRRRLTRERVLQALYAYELSKEPIPLVMENIFGDLKADEEDFEFAKKLVYEAIQHRDEIEKFIRAKVAHWEFDRIAIIDKLLLHIGICEMLYFPDIPPKVTINEAIEVAKLYSTEKSGRFINGVLDAILEDLRTKKILTKSGRGLIDESHPNEENHTPRKKSPRET